MIKDFVPNEVCLSCRGCCRFKDKDSIWFPVLLNSEKDNLAKKVFAQERPEDNNYICSMIEISANRCRIYSGRPFDCRLYPFLLKREGKKVFLAVDLSCPYAKEKQGSVEFVSYIKELLKIIKSKELSALIIDSPQIVQDYPGAQVLKDLDLSP